MKKTLITVMLLSFGLTLFGQFVAKMQVKDDIPGLCDKNEVYALLSFIEGQIQAKCPVSEDDILKRLNSEVTFLKDSSNYQDKGMINLIINCKGEVVQCKMDNKTKNSQLDKQIESVFNTLGKWKSGKLDGRKVDSSRLFSFTIVNGMFTLK